MREIGAMWWADKCDDIANDYSREEVRHLSRE